MYYLRNTATDQFAAQGSRGEHDRQTVPTLEGAWAGDSYAEASEYAQNFGPDWEIEDFT